MLKIILSIFLIGIAGLGYADNFKFNPFTGKPDNTGTFKGGSFTDGKICTYTSSDGTISCTTDPASASAAGNNGEAQYNNTGSLGGLPRSVMNSGGNVGLGTTTTPASTLSVSTNSTTDPFRVSSASSVVGDLFVVENGGNVGIGTVNPARLFSVGSTSQGGFSSTGAATTVGVTNTGAAITNNNSYTQSGTSANTFTGTSTFSNATYSALFTGGNVGIGSTTPTSALAIGTGGGSQQDIVLNGPTVGRPLTISNKDASPGSNGYITMTSGNLSLTGGFQSSMNAISENLLLKTASTTRMTILNGGNIGIGTTNPGFPLDVYGIDSTYTNLRLIDLDGSGGLGIWSNSVAAATRNFQITSNYDSSGSLSIRQGNSKGADPEASGTTRFIIDPNGNVGISDTTPDFSLEAVSTFAVSATSAGDGNRFIVNSSGNVGIGTSSPVGALSVMNGNVGVGTYAPTFPLQVIGNVGIGTTTTASTPYQVNINNVATFNSEFNLASNIGVGTTNINWTNGVYQNVGIGTNGTNSYITFTHPSTGGVAKLQLRILQDGTGSRDLPLSGAWPNTVKWAGGTQPTLTSTAAKSDIVNCTWNGTSDYCSIMQNF